MSEMKLEEFLRPLSQSLGRTAAPDHVEKRTSDGRNVVSERSAAFSAEELTERFVREAHAIGISTSVVAPSAVAEAVVAHIGAFGGSSVVYADDPQVDASGLPSALKAAGYQGMRWDASHAQESIDSCEHADVGITFPFAGIAATATVAQHCDVRSGRAISLLPRAHIAIVAKSTLVPSMADVLEPLGEHPASDLPSTITFITGPSATADIELVHVVGVHGPVSTAVIVVESEAPGETSSQKSR